mgnify:FL=1
MTDVENAKAAGFLGYSGFSTIYGELTAELPFNHCDAQMFGRVTTGAGAVVTKDVAPYSIVVGSPARHIRYRLPEPLAAQVLAPEWWGWDLSGIPGQRDYTDPAAFLRRFHAARDSGRLNRLAPPVITITAQRLSANSAAMLAP